MQWKWQEWGKLIQQLKWGQSGGGPQPPLIHPGFAFNPPVRVGTDSGSRPSKGPSGVPPPTPAHRVSPIAAIKDPEYIDATRYVYKAVRRPQKIKKTLCMLGFRR